MASIADKFMAELVALVADEVIRRLQSGEASASPAPRRSSGSRTTHRLLTPQEAANILRAKKNTLAVWRMTPGAGPDFVKRGRLIFYTPEAIQAYLQRNTIEQKDRP